MIAVMNDNRSCVTTVENPAAARGNTRYATVPGVYLDFLTRVGWSQCQGVADQTNFANVLL